MPSDCIWGPALSETINGCLTKHLEQPKTPIEPLSGALGNLHLDSPPDESSVAPGSSPGETLAMGTCHWKCVCYGIGNFSTCVIARNQLTFLLLFLEKCQVYFLTLSYPSLGLTYSVHTGIGAEINKTFFPSADSQKSLLGV